jgi:sugar lactone lactonase YvrE
MNKSIALLLLSSFCTAQNDFNLILSNNLNTNHRFCIQDRCLSAAEAEYLIQLKPLFSNSSASELKVLTNSLNSTVLGKLASLLQLSSDSLNIFSALREAPVTYNVSHYAGTGTAGGTDGPISSATLNGPVGMAFDAAGNLFIADRSGNRIRKFTLDGTVSTVAGNGTTGSTDGPALSATFNGPYGLDFDLAGNLYIADYMNHKIRKLWTNGTVTTFAGSGVGGFADGKGVSAMLNNSLDIAVSSNGSIYVADFTNHRIRAISPSGDVTTLAGSGIIGSADGAGLAATFNHPISVAICNDTIFTVERWAHKVRKITYSGVVTTLAGNGTNGYADGPASTAMFATPNRIRADKDCNLYVADTGNRRVRMINSKTGFVTTVAGNGTNAIIDGIGTQAAFVQPLGVAVDRSGVIYVSEASSNRVRRINKFLLTYLN